MVGFILGAFGLALFRKEYTTRSFAPFSPLLLGFATGVVLPEFFGCPWCMFMQLGYGNVERLPEILGFIFGIWGGTWLLKRGLVMDRGPRLGLSPRISAPLVVVTIAVTLVWMRSNLGIEGPKEISSMAGVVGVGAILGMAMQRVRFCLVEGVRNTFLMPSRDTFKTGFASILAMVGGSLAYALITRETHFSWFGLSPDKVIRYLFAFGGTTLAGIAFTLAGGCTVWHAVNTGNGSMASLTFLGGMLGASWLHKYTPFLLFTRQFQRFMFAEAPKMTPLYRWIGSHTLYILIGMGVLGMVIWINRKTFFK